MEIGQLIRGQINNINEKGYYVSFPDGGFGHMPYNLKKSARTLNRWDWVEVVVYKIFDDNGIQVCDTKFWEQETLINEFVENAEPGNIYDAVVSSINNNSITVSLNNSLEGLISRDDISWNRVETIDDIVYVGEPLQVVYLKKEHGILHFALRYLDEKPYPDEMYDMSLSELLHFAGHNGTRFIGKAHKCPSYWILENLCSANPGEEGRLLTDPDYGHNLRAVAPMNTPLEENAYYSFEIELVEKEKRLERNQLYQFKAFDFNTTRDPYSFNTLEIFKKNTSPRTNLTAAHLLEEVGGGLYSSKDRMFYELIQNADDAASNKGVNVKVETSGNYLTICHNGFSFDKDDFEAITSAANGTKKANENKTGYKGIGFKSVFYDANQVYIKTGGYQFKFDKTQPQFQDFDRFYFFVNELSSEEDKINFCNRFATEKRNFKGVKDIPWQMEPIWVSSFPSEITSIQKNSNVCIALKLGTDKIEAAKGYRDTIDSIMSNPRFMLFLRNTKRIDFNNRSVSKVIKDGIVTLKNSFNDSRSENFLRKDFTVAINDSAFENLNIDIRRKILEQNDEKIIDATFINSRGQDYDNAIPKKIAIADSTEISFAIPYNTEDVHVCPDTRCSQVSMFAYLPTLVKDFKFPFFINANFVLDSSRERIKGDNPWNHYLMARIADLMVAWAAELSADNDPEALNILSPVLLDETSNDTERLSWYFNDSYKKALESTKFIKDMNGEMAYQNEIIIDETGLSDIIGAKSFCRIIGTTKRLPATAIDCKILKKKIFQKIEKIDDKSLADAVKSNTELNTWIKDASVDEQNKFFSWLQNNNDKYPGLGSELPVFTFGSSQYSAKEIENDCSLLITTEAILPIKDILSKIGISCSDEQLETSPLNGIVSSRSDKAVFGIIAPLIATDTISTSEKITLLETLEQFKDVGISSIKDLRIFKNVKWEYIPLKSLVTYREDAPEWIKPFMIRSEDNCPEVNKYLVDKEHEFKDIIWPNINSINASVDELYATYMWSDSKYTKFLIDCQTGANGDLSKVLGIVEISDLDTRQYFLKKINLGLSSSNHYSHDSAESRILRLATRSLEKPISFASRIYLDGMPIQSISIKDTITCSYANNGQIVKTTMSLSRILPGNKENRADKLKSLFDCASDIDGFIVASEKNLQAVSYELDTLLKIPAAGFSRWPSKRGNAIQYLFAVYYRRHCKGWNNLFVPKIDLSQETQEFVSELMNFLYINKISIVDSSYTYWLTDCVNKRYFNNEFVFPGETLLGTIETWADDENKIKYLCDNGANTSTSNSILLRKSLIENTPFDKIHMVSNEDAFAALRFASDALKDSLPITGENTKWLVNTILKREKCPAAHVINLTELRNSSAEINSDEYLEWQSGHSLKIYIHNGEMPSIVRLKTGESHLDLFNSTKENYYYSSDSQALYINGNVDQDTLLFNIARENKTAFTLDDYKTLCLVGKTTISSTELGQLKDELQQKNDIILEYQRRFGSLDTAINSQSSSHIRKGEIDPISDSEQRDAHLEAQRFLMEIEQTWEFPDGYGESDEEGFPYCFSTADVTTPSGELSIVLKSHILENAPLMINPMEWEFLIQKKALLLIYTGSDIKRIKVKDLIMDQSKISLSFSTENLDIEERVDAFAKALRYFKELHFDFESFNLSKKAESIRGITDLHDGKQASGLGDADI